MLSMSASDEKELETWRSRYGRCQLPENKMRLQPNLSEALDRLPHLMRIILRTRLKAAGWLGSVCLEAEEISDIEATAKIKKREIMVMLLNVASSLAQGTGPADHIGAVTEGATGGFYIGAPIVWQNKNIKFSVHGVQAAVMNAWSHGEMGITNLMVETNPCACCRQFLRETWSWHKLKIFTAEDGFDSLKTGAIKETSLDLTGLRLDNINSRLLGEAKRGIALNKPNMNEMVQSAADAASMAYAPYSKNYAGIALRTKRGVIHKGRCVEVGASVAGVMAIESAITDLALCGGVPADIKEILLVETRGTITQFSATQKLAAAMGDVPFRFMMT